LKIVPTGSVGELYIGGIGVARAYLHQPALTAERFVPDPFSKKPGARLYKSGDQARSLPDGTIEFLGRTDYQIKIHGNRVELTEIEATLLQHPDVQAVAVVARETSTDQRQLVAHVVSRQHIADAEDLRQFLTKKLPQYMIPTSYVLTDILPTTPSGKIDRNALAASAPSRPISATKYVAPRTNLERYLVAAWEEILGIKSIGVNDSFFELGGDSIQGLIFINKLQEKLQRTVHIVLLFDAPCISLFRTVLARNYPEEIIRIWGEVVASDAADGTRPYLDRPGVVDQVKVRKIRSLIKPISQRATDRVDERQNPTAIFILCPPRSGSTLLRVMLGGHPSLFAPPATELLSFSTLAERKAAFSGRDHFWLEGTIRAIMEIRGCDTEEAKRIMQDCENSQMTTKEFYRLLQEWIGKRTLVEKTARNSIDIERLKRAEADFANARYIHLLRHPYGMIRSFEEARLDQIIFRDEHPFTVRELAELLWVVSHQNILNFLREVPTHRHIRISFEDLVRHPEATMHDACHFLGLEFHEAMIQPYSGRRMTDGIYADSRMVGDVKFHEHRKIDPDVADKWKTSMRDYSLGNITWQIASELGYERPGKPVETYPGHGSSLPYREVATVSLVHRASQYLPLSFAQERLWFLNQYLPDSTAYNVVKAVRFTGMLNQFALQRSLNEIVRRHETMRTTFSLLEVGPVQVIQPMYSVSLPVIDLESLPDTERESEVDRLIVAQVRMYFDLAKGPVARFKLLRLSQEDHVLLINIHHIVLDNWSWGIFLMELGVLYPAFVSGRSSSLAELPIQYADFAVWQRRESMQVELAYWKRQLGGPLPILDLQTDRPRTAVRTFDGAHESLILPASMTAQLGELALQEGASLFMTLLAAFSVLLHRYSGQVDLLIGTPVSNRTLKQIENLIGFFVNTLVIRVDLSGQPSFREVMQRVRKVTLEAYTYQNMPFEQLVQELQPERHLTHSPITQILFGLQNASTPSLELPGLNVSILERRDRTPKSDITVLVTKETYGLRTFVEYDANLFDATTIMRLLEHWQMVLHSVVADPDECISTMSLLTNSERRVLDELNATAARAPSTDYIHDLFKAQVARTPDTIALVYDDQHVTYRELNARADQLAHHLHGLGVRPETTVGICIERSPEMVIGMLGILKAGGAYLPLDPAYPQERLALMIEDTQAPVIVTQGSILAGLPECCSQRVCLDTDWSTITAAAVTELTPSATPAQLAYIIYTSGSTGRPKGVAISHASAVALLDWARQAYAPHQLAGVLATTSICFDLSVFEVFAPLSWGGTVILAKDILQLPHLPASRRVTLINTVPSAMTEVVRLGVLPDAVRTVNLAGETVKQSLVQRIYRDGRVQQVYNLYGPTEDTTYSTCALTVYNEITDPPIGRPVTNTQVYLLDEHMQPVPVGVKGQIYIGGEGLARGYYNSPELTAERFLPNPFSHMPGARMYRTGDLAHHRPDGTIEFVGRADLQVKIRGFRIELGEIELVLTQHPLVRDAVVLAREDEQGSVRLVAYVRPDADVRARSGDGGHASRSATSESTALSRELRAYLHKYLPNYMVPTAFLMLDELPLTPNGKVDRKALPGPEGCRPELEEPFVAPRTQIEQSLAKIWGRVLGIDQIGVYDDFFHLGGHSLLATQVISQIRIQCAVELQIRTLFEQPTIAALATHIETIEFIKRGTIAASETSVTSEERGRI
jgi:amino acid adenylation domain-containing protein